MRIPSFVLIVISLILILQPKAEAQTVLKASVIGNGGAPMEGGGYRVNGTLGQPAIGPSTGTSNVYAGFWYIVSPPSEPLPAIGLNPSSFSFYAPSGGPNPAVKKLNIRNTGEGTLAWSVSSNAGWLTLDPGSGSCTTETDEVTVSVVGVAGLANGTHNGSITVTATGASNTPQIISVSLAIRPPILYQRQLAAGWNHISFPISKCFYSGTYPDDQPNCLEEASVSSLVNWFSSVLNPGTAWEMVIGQKGAMHRTLPFNSLTYMSPIYSYWVKIINPGGAILSIAGPPFDPDCVIELPSGWTQIGLPLDKGYHDTNDPPENMPWVTDWQKVDPPVAEHVFSSIKGDFDMVVGEYGAYSPGTSNSLHHMAHGLGFWIRLKKDVNLQYSDMGISIMAAPKRK